MVLYPFFLGVQCRPVALPPYMYDCTLLRVGVQPASEDVEAWQVPASIR